VHHPARARRATTTTARAKGWASATDDEGYGFSFERRFAIPFVRQKRNKILKSGMPKI
jgi:hypothetical protein